MEYNLLPCYQVSTELVLYYVQWLQPSYQAGKPSCSQDISHKQIFIWISHCKASSILRCVSSAKQNIILLFKKQDCSQRIVFFLDIMPISSQNFIV